MELNSEIFYKYRSLDNFKFVLDILVNQRLYASDFESMNDPMEGVYYYLNSNSFDKKIINEIYEEKKKIKICSLSKEENSALMWAHYANSSKGIAIGVKIDRNVYEIHEIDYVVDFPTFDIAELNIEKAIHLLTNKLKPWAYEKEYRIFNKGDEYVYVTIEVVIYGSRINKHDKLLIDSLINVLNKVEGRAKIKRRGIAAKYLI